MKYKLIYTAILAVLFLGCAVAQYETARTQGSTAASAKIVSPDEAQSAIGQAVITYRSDEFSGGEYLLLSNNYVPSLDSDVYTLGVGYDLNLGIYILRVDMVLHEWGFFEAADWLIDGAPYHSEAILDPARDVLRGSVSESVIFATDRAWLERVCRAQEVKMRLAGKRRSPTMTLSSANKQSVCALLEAIDARTAPNDTSERAAR